MRLHWRRRELQDAHRALRETRAQSRDVYNLSADLAHLVPRDQLAPLVLAALRAKR